MRELRPELYEGANEIHTTGKLGSAATSWLRLALEKKLIDYCRRPSPRASAVHPECIPEWLLAD